MAGARHRTTGSWPSRRLVAPVAVTLLLLGAIAVGGVAVLRGGSSVRGCSGDVILTVMTAPSLTDALTSVADGYNAAHRVTDGRCVHVKIATIDSSQVASSLQDGWTGPSAGAPPDVWVPESATWLTLARAAGPAQRLVPPTGLVVATSPVVIAMPRPMAERLGWPNHQLSWADLQKSEGDPTFWARRGRPGWGGFRVAFADPRTSAAGLTAVVNAVASGVGRPASQLTDRMFTDDLAVRGAILTFERRSEEVARSDSDILAGLREAGPGDAALAHLSAFAVPESEVYQYNRGRGGSTPPVTLTASYPTDGLVVDDVPYVTFSRTAGDPTRSKAAADFLSVLAGQSGRAALTATGFRTVGRTNPAFTPDVGLVPQLRTERQMTIAGRVLAAVRIVFQRIHQRGNTLAVYDTSGSMGDVVPDSGGKTKLQVAVEAANSALPLFAPDSYLGLWRFSAQLDGDRDYRELVPVGPLNESVNGVPRPTALADAANGIVPAGATALYDTTLAAFRALSAHYLPNRPNQVVLLTDGKNDDPGGGISLDDLIAALKREYSPRRPVHVITIAYGPDADPDALRRISAATGSKSYPALYTNNIIDALVNALTDP
jgi:Ca-activated chloride channel family protein